METAAPLVDDASAGWQVVREGAQVASVTTRLDGTGFVVATQVYGKASDAERIRPYRFPDREAAEAFVRDLVTSFTYLGCQVARAA
ncbi:MAG: hypothetical protein MSC30_13875 [Gaiellaceae bacterium MAG52_C11]|nr:hypothetical protein [Candidatus Gaiellasilicea maunaloa]